MNQPYGTQLIIFLAALLATSIGIADVEHSTAIPQLQFAGESQELLMNKVADQDLVQVYIGEDGPDRTHF